MNKFKKNRIIIVCPKKTSSLRSGMNLVTNNKPRRWRGEAQNTTAVRPWSFIFSSRSGVATIPTIIALTIMILAVSIGVASVSLTENLIALGQNQSSRALLYAEAGARDALVRMVRNKNYTCATTDCYSVSFVTNGCSSDEGCARVSVSAGVGSLVDPKVITSSGSVKNKTRKIEVDVIFDTSLNGEVSTTTWREISN